jgi:hypothetical protein
VTSNKTLYPEDDAVDFLRFYLPSLYSLGTIIAEVAPLIFYCRFVLNLASYHNLSSLHSSQAIDLGIFHSSLTSFLALLPPNLLTTALLVGDVILIAAFGFKQVSLDLP